MMKALGMEEYGCFVYRDWPKPVPGEGEVLVRVKACAVCGSDVHGMDGSTKRRQPPIIMGHEAAGQIEALGPGVTDYKVGDRVTFDSTVYCNACDNCRAGRVNLCAARQVLGVSTGDYRRHGAFAEYVAVPAYILYRLPAHVSYVQAAMVEPLAIAYHGATRTQIGAGDSVLIAGVGTIGILTLQVVMAMGAGPIIAVDLDDKKLEKARRLGAAAAFNAKDPDLNARILAASPEGLGCHVAIDCTGIQDTVAMCVSSVRLGGRVVLVGNIAPKVDFALQAVVTREISLFGSCSSAGEYDECLRLIAEGAVDVDSLISKAVPLKEGNAWIQKVYKGEEGLTKILLLTDERDG